MNKSKDFINFLQLEDIDFFLEDTPIDRTVEIEKDLIIKINMSKPTATVVEKPKAFDLTDIKDLESLKKAIANLNHPLKQTALEVGVITIAVWIWRKPNMTK